jgi:hypothetical protein
MQTINATQVRKNWSEVVDSVVREKPAFIKRTRDYMLLSEIGLIEKMLELYDYNAELLIEDDGSVTMSLDEIDLVENGLNEKDTINKMAFGILDYAQDYYNDFNYWYSTLNRKNHLPYVMKALILGDTDKIGGIIKCRRGYS